VGSEASVSGCGCDDAGGVDCCVCVAGGVGCLTIGKSGVCCTVGGDWRGRVA
jgi:hypothetical protein